MTRDAFYHAVPWATLAVAAACFAVACFVPVGHGHGGFMEDGFEPDGLWMLFFAWLGVPDWTLAWLANPAMILAAVCLVHGKYPVGSLVSAIALGLALIPLAELGAGQMPTVRLDTPVALVFHDGRLELRLGYFLWVATSASLLGGTSLAWWLQRQRRLDAWRQGAIAPSHPRGA